MKRFLPQPALGAALAALLPLTGLGANLYFQPAGGASGSLNDAASWSPGTVPGGEDALYFTLTGAYGATATGDLTADFARFSQGAATLQLGAATLNLLRNLYIDSAAEAGVTSTVTLASGTLTTGAQAQLGNGANPVRMIVEGEGAVFRPHGCAIGSTGSGHSFILRNGGRMHPTANVGVGDFAGNCSMLITGAGTRYESEPNLARLTVGGNQRNCTLEIADGAQCIVPGGNYTFLGLSSSYNTVRVTGEGSLLRAGDVRYGTSAGQFNTLEVTQGGWLDLTNSVTFSYNAGSSNNVLLVSDGGRLTYTTRGNNFTVVNPDNCVRVEGAGSVAAINGMTVRNGGLLEALDGARLVLTNNLNIGNASDARPAHVTVRGAALEIPTSLIGFAGTGHSLSFEDGAQTPFRLARVTLTGAENRMNISGEGTAVNVNQMWVGRETADNRLTVRDGATLVAGHLQLGNGVNGLRNTLEVLDGGSVIGTNNCSIIVGGAAAWTSSAATASNGLIHVRNGAVTCTRGDGGITLRNESTLRLEGTNNCVEVRKFTCIDGAAIEFVPPPDAAEAAPAVLTLSDPAFDETAVVRMPMEETRRCMQSGGGLYVILTSQQPLATADLLQVDTPYDIPLIIGENTISIRIPDHSGTVFLVQ